MQSNLFLEVEPKKIQNNPYLKWPANFFSYIFHPIFIPIYVIAFIVFIHPSYFSGFSQNAKVQTILISALNLVFFPLMSVLLLKALGFIDSIFLRTRKDRIIPYMASGIFFFWAYTVFKKQEIYPPIMSIFILGVFLASSAGLLANIYYKISMHAIGVGGWLGIFTVIAKENTMLMTWPLAIVLIITGVVCTSRFLVSNHTQKDIYTGLATGFICQLVAYWVS
ncbi:MAG: hypothetical protein ABL929_11835 [Ferruginibacter sp.]|nr:hypothetical protein [Ferruginibacter sp.]